ncbi:DUF481 domain-containing protein [Allosphingosinicella vermicomposti]|uniref:DUF481 domain-containing protein n=1 Tax=Allosphingosinicella vermicomposti TaxID=614671 RepID=UPI000D0EA056|nr:DUF481 domain-containing protein [Allosphingosinicella vermicomposti]
MLIPAALALCLAAPALAVPAEPALAAPVRAMIDAALDSGDAKAVETVLALARKANPDAIAEIDVIENAWRSDMTVRAAEAERVRTEELRAADMLDNWKGQVELGASRSTGNSDSLGLYGATNLEREGIQWRHKLSARADIQETNGQATTERVLAAWQPNFKFDDRLYIFGLGQYEHDRFLGYINRYTLGAGAGYGVLKGGPVTLDVEGGPALRHTDFYDDGRETKVAGRASMALAWKITPTFHFAQTGSLYLEKGDSSASASTTFDTKLIGALKARFSYNIQYERDAPAGRDPVDTLSRATLVYSF